MISEVDIQDMQNDAPVVEKTFNSFQQDLQALCKQYNFFLGGYISVCKCVFPSDVTILVDCTKNRGY